METIAVPKSQKTEVAPIQWKQLWSLAALYASIIIGWIAYENYQPKLLVQFNFTNFTFALILAQAIITVVTPPIAGRMGDRFRFTTGLRLPIISSGISFAAMILGSPGDDHFMADRDEHLHKPRAIYNGIVHSR